MVVNEQTRAFDAQYRELTAAIKKAREAGLNPWTIKETVFMIWRVMSEVD
jgi:hypothetical protein